MQLYGCPKCGKQIWPNDKKCLGCDLPLVWLGDGAEVRSIKKETDPNGVDQHAPGAKLDAGKVRAGLLGMFSRALMAVAEIGTHGAAKYSRGGWQFVEDGITRYDDAKWRHLLKGYMEEDDPDSDLKHLAHEAWNALAKLELILREEADGRD